MSYISELEESLQRLIYLHPNVRLPDLDRYRVSVIEGDPKPLREFCEEKTRQAGLLTREAEGLRSLIAIPLTDPVFWDRLEEDHPSFYREPSPHRARMVARDIGAYLEHVDRRVEITQDTIGVVSPIVSWVEKNPPILPTKEFWREGRNQVKLSRGKVSCEGFTLGLYRGNDFLPSQFSDSERPIFAPWPWWLAHTLAERRHTLDLRKIQRIWDCFLKRQNPKGVK